MLTRLNDPWVNKDVLVPLVGLKNKQDTGVFKDAFASQWTVLQPPTPNCLLEEAPFFNSLAAYGLCLESLYRQHPHSNLLSACQLVKDCLLIMTENNYLDGIDFMTRHDYFTQLYRREPTQIIENQILTVMDIARVRYDALRREDGVFSIQLKELTYLAKCLWNVYELFNHKLSKLYMLTIVPYLFAQRDKLDTYSRIILVLLARKLKLLYKDPEIEPELTLKKHLSLSMRVKNINSKVVINTEIILL
jgi:hypothetical protein